MRIALLRGISILVLGLALIVAVAAPKVFTADPRDVLTDELKEDISRIIEAEILSEKDQEIVHKVLVSLAVDSLLKTQEEIAADDKKTGSQLRDTKRNLGRIIEKQLMRRNVENRPLPSVTPDLAYDFARLSRLRSIFEKEGLKSKALDALLQQVWTAIWLTTSA